MNRFGTSLDDHAGGHSQDFISSTRHLLRCFKETHKSASRAGKIENAHRKVQFNTFIEQNRQIVSVHEQLARMRLERDRWMQRGDHQGGIMAKASRKEEGSADDEESPIKIAKFDV